MITAATQRKYISELVWLPTYLALAALVLSSISNSSLAAVVLIVGLIASRLVLELAYRFVFGDSRLQWRVGAAAFALQLMVWGALWALYAQTGAA
jgi:hypothetical protein